MGARQRGGKVVGRVEEGMEVLACVCACLSQGVYVYVSSEGRGQVDELEMQEVYRWAKDRAAKKVSFQILGTRTRVCCGVRKRVGDAT